MASSTTEFAPAHDGLKQLRRRWKPTGAPRAAMLLVHGIGEHSGRYEHVGGAFADAGIDVLAHDQRGFGQSDGPRAFVEDFDEFLADLQLLIGDRRSLDVPVILMGHSLGGLIASAYLVSNRPQPDLAVLSSPALAANMPRWQRVLAPALGTVVPRFRVAADFDGSILTRDPEVGAAYESDPLRVSASTARLGREILRAMNDVEAGLERIELPMYILHGDADTLIPPSASEPLGDLPNATRRVWPGLRHECLNEPEQDEVIAAIVEWLDDNI